VTQALTGRAVSVSDSTASTAASTLTAPSTAATPRTAPLPSNGIVRNVTYDEQIFSTYKALGIKSRPFKDKMKEKGIALPTNARGETICLTYHVLGMCNERCKQASDHAPHDATENEQLRAWCEQHYKVDA